MITIINKEEKYYRNNKRRRLERRNEEGLTKREQEKVDNINKIKEFVELGLKNKDIAEKLGLSVRQVQRLKKDPQGDMKWLFINMWVWGFIFNIINWGIENVLGMLAASRY